MNFILTYEKCSPGMNTKKNFEHWMSEHRTFWTSHFGPKSNFKHVEHHKKTEQFANIKLYVPRLVFSHNNRTEPQTLPNITFWSNTELWTCRTSQKNWTVREHQTVRSKTNLFYDFQDRFCVILINKITFWVLTPMQY